MREVQHDIQCLGPSPSFWFATMCLWCVPLSASIIRLSDHSVDMLTSGLELHLFCTSSHVKGLGLTHHFLLKTHKRRIGRQRMTAPVTFSHTRKLGTNTTLVRHSGWARWRVKTSSVVESLADVLLRERLRNENQWFFLNSEWQLFMNLDDQTETQAF